MPVVPPEVVPAVTVTLLSSTLVPEEELLDPELLLPELLLFERPPLSSTEVVVVLLVMLPVTLPVVAPVEMVALLSSTLITEVEEPPEVELTDVLPVTLPVAEVPPVVVTGIAFESSDDFPEELLPPPDDEEELEDEPEDEDFESSEPFPELLLPDEELDWARATEEPAVRRLARTRRRSWDFMVWMIG